METPVDKQHRNEHFLRSAGYRVGLSSIISKKCFGICLAACAGIVAVSAESQAREYVSFSQNYPAGTIIIKQSERRLYFTIGSGTAVRYPIAIGRAGKAWQGETFVQGKFVSPAWSAPWVVLRDHPNLSRIIPGGSPRNPMGAAAITLNLSDVAIHGTTASMRRSVGTAASYGCIRMYNEDVVDLYHRVEVGTPVVAIP
jgi:lipoprotein-anchoring transpeptidase ErfK/SrfK